MRCQGHGGADDHFPVSISFFLASPVTQCVEEPRLGLMVPTTVRPRPRAKCTPAHLTRAGEFFENPRLPWSVLDAAACCFGEAYSLVPAVEFPDEQTRVRHSTPLRTSTPISRDTPFTLLPISFSSKKTLLESVPLPARLTSPTHPQLATPCNAGNPDVDDGVNVTSMSSSDVDVSSFFANKHRRRQIHRSERVHPPCAENARRPHSAVNRFRICLC